MDQQEADAECTYLCGNSLGLQPKNTRTLINQELDVWQNGYLLFSMNMLI